MSLCFIPFIALALGGAAAAVYWAWRYEKAQRISDNRMALLKEYAAEIDSLKRRLRDRNNPLLNGVGAMARAVKRVNESLELMTKHIGGTLPPSGPRP